MQTPLRVGEMCRRQCGISSCHSLLFLKRPGGFGHRWIEDTLCLCVSSAMSVAYAQSGIISLHVGYGGAIPQTEETDRGELVLGMLAQSQMDLIEA